MLLGSATALADTVTYNLSRPYEPYLTATETTIWENRNLADIESFTCTVKGGWIGTATADIGVIYDRTPTSFTVQFQCVNGGCKMVRAYFRQDGANIVARADKAGRVDESGYGSVQPNSAFTTSLATSDSSDGYGVKTIHAFGDVAQTIDALPADADSIVVDGGVLQINVTADTTISTPISGTGGLRFHGPGEAVETQHAFDQYVTTANQTFLANTDVFDLEITSAVFNGGWCGRAEGAAPCNVTTNLEAKTMKVQLQKAFPNGAIRGIVVQLAQSGDDVVVRGLMARQAGNGQALGSNVETWNGASPAIASSASANGYGLESISFVRRALPTVTLSGAKSWTGGTVADGCRVRVTTSQLAARTTAKAVNGGILELAATGVWNVFPRNTFVVTTNSTLRLSANFAVNQFDKIVARGGTVECAIDNSNQYLNDVLLADGASIRGFRVQVCYQNDALWITEGASEISIEAPVRTMGALMTFALDTSADIVFGNRVYQHETDYAGAKIEKRGSAMATFMDECSTTGRVTVAKGALRFDHDASLGPLVVAGNAAMEIGAGAAVTFAASGAAAWTEGARLDITGEFGEPNHVVRFGTDASGLTAAQIKAIRANDTRCVLDGNGWLHPGAQAFVLVVR